jgi:hypothetical protein
MQELSAEKFHDAPSVKFAYGFPDQFAKLHRFLILTSYTLRSWVASITGATQSHERVFRSLRLDAGLLDDWQPFLCIGLCAVGFSILL